LTSLRDHVPARVAGVTSHRATVRAPAVWWRTPAWICLGAGIGLSLIGIDAIDIAGRLEPSDALRLAPIATRQAIFLGIGLVAAGIVALPPYRLIGKLAVPGMGVMLGLLVFLLIPMVPAWLVAPRNGTRGWINMGVVDFQPAEIAKIAYVLVVARYLRFRTEHRELIGLLPLGMLTAIPVGLITLQPDLGTASLFVPSLFAILLAAGARLRHLAIIVVAASLAAPAMYPLLKPHQKERIVALVHQMRGDESLDHDSNFQPAAAQRLAGAGQLDGMPDERSRSLVYFNRLPEAHNDMVFAVIVNRHGLLGGLAVMGLYVAWMLGAVLTAARCKEPFGRLVVVGLSAFIAAQSVVNIGMNIGVLPIIGVTLPFVSYGGSSMLASWFMTGLIVSVGVHRSRQPHRPSFEFEEGHE